MLLSLINPQNGNLAFKLFSFSDNSYFDHIQRNNFYTLIWLNAGTGILKSDFSEYPFNASTLFAFAPYQPFAFFNDSVFKGVALQFHSDFYCIHRNPKETNCDTVLFNSIYEAPFFLLNPVEVNHFSELIQHLIEEFESNPSSDLELLVPYLKIILVHASRLRQRQTDPSKLLPSTTPPLLQNLKSAIETHFKQKHTPGDYAALLHISPNALAKITKAHFNKTLTHLISERIIIEAKRELYATNKTVKEIAYYLGYADAFYFSRFFKAHTDVSPQLYRETVGFGRGAGV